MQSFKSFTEKESRPITKEDNEPIMSYTFNFKTLNPAPPQPPIDVIIATGDRTSPSSGSICAQFAKDFDFYHLHTPDHLRTLVDLDDTKESSHLALGYIHPSVLKKKLDAGTTIAAIFLVPILQHKIDQEVALGERKFLISGLKDDMEALTQLSKKVASISAILSFRPNGTDMSKDREEVETGYGPRVVVIVESGDVSEMYEQLLGEVFARSLRQGEVVRWEVNEGLEY